VCSNALGIAQGELQRGVRKGRYRQGERQRRDFAR
jgi:hypothetical protein